MNSLLSSLFFHSDIHRNRWKALCFFFFKSSASLIWSLSQTWKQPISLKIYFLLRGAFYTSDSQQCTFVCKPTVLDASSWINVGTEERKQRTWFQEWYCLSENCYLQYVCTFCNNQIRAMSISTISILLSVTGVEDIFTYFET